MNYGNNPFQSNFKGTNICNNKMHSAIFVCSIMVTTNFREMNKPKFCKIQFYKKNKTDMPNHFIYTYFFFWTDDLSEFEFIFCKYTVHWGCVKIVFLFVRYDISILLHKLIPLNNRGNFSTFLSTFFFKTKKCALLSWKLTIWKCFDWFSLEFYCYFC